MILLVDVIFSLVKVSIFPPMTSMVEKLPVFMFAVPLELIVLMLPVFMFAVPLEIDSVDVACIYVCEICYR